MPDKRDLLPVDIHAAGHITYKVTVTVAKCLPDGRTEDKEEEPRTTIHVINVPVVPLAVAEALSAAVMEVQSLLLEETDSESEDDPFGGSDSAPE